MQLTRGRANLPTFIQALLERGAVVNSILIFIVVLAWFVPFMLGVDAGWLTALTVGAAGFALVAATYFVWKEAVEALPEEPTLRVEPVPERMTVATNLASGMPQVQNSKLDLELDISNPGKERVYLERVEIANWAVPNTLFEDYGPITLKGKQKGAFRQLGMPVCFEGEERRTDIRLFVELGASTDEFTFPRALVETDHISVTVRFHLKNLAGLENLEEVEFVLSLRKYKQWIVAQWKQQGKSDLLARAGGIDDLFP